MRTEVLIRRGLSSLLVCGLFAVASQSIADKAEDNGVDVVPEGARDALRDAFRARYDCDLTFVARLWVRNRGGEGLLHRAEVAVKRIDERLHTLGRFTDPAWFRGRALLSIENRDRSDDHFLYLPSLRKTRRITSAQRADAFLGTDLSYEDFERRYAEDYDVAWNGKAKIQNEDVRVIVGSPRYESGYGRVEFFIAETDAAILETRYFKRGNSEPFKVIQVPRSALHVEDGHLVPKQMMVRNLERGTTTEVELERVQVNPPLDDDIFTERMLRSKKPIPGIASVGPAATRPVAAP